MLKGIEQFSYHCIGSIGDKIINPCTFDVWDVDHPDFSTEVKLLLLKILAPYPINTHFLTKQYLHPTLNSALNSFLENSLSA